MMGVTHALIGLLIGGSAAYLFPSYFIPAALASLAGGLFPDLDLVFEHRKTLHFPIIYTVLALFSGVLATLHTASWSVLVFYFIISAAVHSWLDILGGGLEERPWIPSSDKAVYSHVLDRWFAPRRWIRYDGAPEDLLLSILIAVPLYFYYTDELIRGLIIALLVIGTVYVLVRKRIVDWAPEWVKEIL